MKNAETLSRVIDRWLPILAEHYDKEISAANAEIYHLALSDLDPEAANSAFTAALQSCRFMPTVADIRAHVKARDQIAGELASEKEWQAALRAASQYDPDLAYGSPSVLDWKGELAWKYQPNLSSAGEHAVRAAGGWSALHDAYYDSAQATWRRKTFMEAYKSYSKGESLGLTEGDSRKLLAGIPGIEKLSLKKL